MTKKDNKKSTDSTVETNVSAVNAAKNLAQIAHNGQKYGHKPFVKHLHDTVMVLEEFGYSDEDLLVSAWLHDIVEDTDVLIEQVYSEFGQRVGDLVDAVTDGPGDTRKEKKERPYKMIPDVPGAIVLKLADRIANVRHSIRSRNGKNRWIRRYRIEHIEFRKNLRKTDAIEMWNYLDNLLGYGEE